MDWEELLWLSASWAPNRVRVTLTYAYAPFLPKYIGAATMTTYAEGKRGRPSLQRWSTQQGQAFLFIVILIAFFLLAVLGLATDYTQVWAHRQMAQGAARVASQSSSSCRTIRRQQLADNPPSETGARMAKVYGFVPRLHPNRLRHQPEA